MAVNSFNSLLRQCVAAMYSEKGIKAIECIAGYRLSDKAQGVLKDLVILVMETEYFKPDTKEFLANKVKRILDSINSNYCAQNIRTSRSRIFYDFAKLRAAIGEDAMDIIIKQPKADLKRINEKIQEMLEKHHEKSLIEGFALKLPNSNCATTSLSDGDYEMLKEMSKYGSRKGKMLMEFNFTPEILGYIKYLETNKAQLEGIEKERYNELATWLK